MLQIQMHHNCIIQAVSTLLAALPTLPPSAQFLLCCAIPDTFQHVIIHVIIQAGEENEMQVTHSSLGADGDLNFFMLLSEPGRLLWMGKQLQS